MLIADLTHFLTSDGSIGPKEGPALLLADHLTKIVVSATAAVSIETAAVHCRKRPKRKPCEGEILTTIDPETKQIIWYCPVCEDQCMISNWQGSLWDCTNNVSTQSH